MFSVPCFKWEELILPDYHSLVQRLIIFKEGSKAIDYERNISYDSNVLFV